ncbi:hypothetical protein BB560_000048 [Smittium megazygosporum]|uniref:Uncharacterized protein n=1 Tax=Smittium megazygosporum TaxID=133381 RepID=A0A2T9ZLG0_9FUNG|nr:hypothetical protein BB560_000048 [Smittium megazygosporum]
MGNEQSKVIPEPRRRYTVIGNSIEFTPDSKVPASSSNINFNLLREQYIAEHGTSIGQTPSKPAFEAYTKPNDKITGPKVKFDINTTTQPEEKDENLPEPSENEIFSSFIFDNRQSRNRRNKASRQSLQFESFDSIIPKRNSTFITEYILDSSIGRAFFSQSKEVNLSEEEMEKAIQTLHRDLRLSLRFLKNMETTELSKDNVDVPCFKFLKSLNVIYQLAQKRDISTLFSEKKLKEMWFEKEKSHPALHPYTGISQRFSIDSEKFGDLSQYENFDEKEFSNVSGISINFARASQFPDEPKKNYSESRLESYTSSEESLNGLVSYSAVDFPEISKTLKAVNSKADSFESSKEYSVTLNSSIDTLVSENDPSSVFDIVSGKFHRSMSISSSHSRTVFVTEKGFVPGPNPSYAGCETLDFAKFKSTVPEKQLTGRARSKSTVNSSFEMENHINVTCRTNCKPSSTKIVSGSSIHPPKSDRSYSAYNPENTNQGGPHFAIKYDPTFSTRSRSKSTVTSNSFNRFDSPPLNIYPQKKSPALTFNSGKTSITEEYIKLQARNQEPFGPQYSASSSNSSRVQKSPSENYQHLDLNTSKQSDETINLYLNDIKYSRRSLNGRFEKGMLPTIPELS